MVKNENYSGILTKTTKMQNIPKLGECKIVKYKSLEKDGDMLHKFMLTVDINEDSLVKINDKLYIIGDPYKKAKLYDENFNLLYRFPVKQYNTEIRYFNQYILIKADSTHVVIKNNELVKNVVVQCGFVFVDDMLISDTDIYKFTEKYYYFSKNKLYMYVKIADVGYIFGSQLDIRGSVYDKWNLSDYFTNIPEHMNDEILKNYVNLQLEQIKLAQKLEDIDAKKFWKLPYNGNDIDYIMKRIRLITEDFNEANYVEEISLVKSLVQKGGISENLFTSIEKMFAN